MKFLNAVSILSASLALLGALTSPSVAAQTLYGVDALGGFSNPLVVEFTGPSAGGACAYPAGPMAGYPAFMTTTTACPGTLPFPGYLSLAGDIAVNHYTETIWVAGLNEIGEYTPAGAQVSGFVHPLAPNITGLGMDSTGGRLWVASAGEYSRILPGCGAGTVNLGPFTNPMGAALTDIDWDPMSNTVWVCTAAGDIGNFLPGAAGPACSFNVLALGLTAPLTGLALDLTTPGISSAYKVVAVTDGTTIARINVSASCAAGVPTLAAPTFAFPLNPFPVTGGPISGLAFAAHGVTFGASGGCDIALTGQAVVGTIPGVELFNADPGQAALFVSSGALCPTIAFKGQPVYVLPTIVTPAVAHGGSKTVAAPIPAAAPVGARIFMQWFNHKAAGGWECSPGLMLTTSRP